jgi:hypothetical protein
MAADRVLSSSSGSLPRIAVSDPATRGRASHFSLISQNEILYAFIGTSLRYPLIQASWKEQKRLRRSRVFIRTPKGVFMTRFRSLAALQASLDSRPFLRIHQGLLINVLKITQLDASGRLNQVAVALSDGTVEWLSISRRSLKTLRSLVGLSSRAVSGGHS